MRKNFLEVIIPTILKFVRKIVICDKFTYFRNQSCKVQTQLFSEK
ncbi:hypothetical protein LEP1GSC073_3458 [Leptospira noguchii str. Cascata]|nr:hypothetical protein LEP1GSC073_3458 [Leptospira noguchii str. Cascata]